MWWVDFCGEWASVARGLAPVGARSAPPTFPVIPKLQVLGLLRSPTGASPLATEATCHISPLTTEAPLPQVPGLRWHTKPHTPVKLHALFKEFI
ncbi:hypothetical protein C1X65_11125 [Pseudomonas sp. FW305-70]|nr:hypothetical protein C1X65_11125 [Pseudomonas sp. FW305-70]